MFLFDCTTVKANGEQWDFQIAAVSIHEVIRELVENNVLDFEEVKFTVVIAS